MEAIKFNGGILNGFHISGKSLIGSAKKAPEGFTMEDAERIIDLCEGTPKELNLELCGYFHIYVLRGRAYCCQSMKILDFQKTLDQVTNKVYDDMMQMKNEYFVIGRLIEGCFQYLTNNPTAYDAYTVSKLDAKRFENYEEARAECLPSEQVRAY